MSRYFQASVVVLRENSVPTKIFAEIYKLKLWDGSDVEEMRQTAFQVNLTRTAI